MRGAFLLTLLLAGVAWTTSADAPAGSRELTLGEILTAVSLTSPRTEGSASERELVSFLAARLEALGAAFSQFDFGGSDFDHSFSSCLRVDVPGALKDTLIVAVPLDSPPGSAGRDADGSVNIALALDLVASARRTPAAVSLTVLFLGAELGTGGSYPMGSALYLLDFRPGGARTAVLYLDLASVQADVRVRGGGGDTVSPFWLMDRCAQALRAARVRASLRADEAQIFRLGATGERTLIEPWLRAGYPAVELRSAASGAALPPQEGRLEAFAAFLRGFLDAGDIPDEWDRHYLVLEAGGVSLLVGERAWVSVFLGVLAAWLLTSLAFGRGLRKYLRTLVRNAPAILPVAALSFAFLAAGTGILQAMLALRGFPTLWTHAPLEFLALKICAALFLYAALYNLLRRLPFPRNGSFYSAAAMFFLLVDTMVVAVFDISFAFPFAWAFLFVFLSSVMRNRWAKALFVLPAPAWGIQALIVAFQAPALPLCRFLLLSPVWGNLLIAGACLPFILVLLRIGLIFPGHGILRRRAREPAFAAVLLGAGALLAVRLAAFTPYTPASPQPVDAVQTLVVDAADGSTSAAVLVLDSPAPLGALSVVDADGSHEVPPESRSHATGLAPAASPVSVSVDSERFLKLRNLTLRVQMPASPLRFTAAVSSDADFIMYDSSFPAVRDSPREYRLLVGAFAPDRLSLQISLPADAVFRVVLTMEFEMPLIGAQVSAPSDRKVSTRVRVVRTLEVAT